MPHAVAFPDTACMQRLALSDSGFVFDPVTGRSFTVNDTGLALLRILQREASLAEVIRALREQFDVDEATAERDVVEFAGVLTGEFR